MQTYRSPKVEGLGAGCGHPALASFSYFIRPGLGGESLDPRVARHGPAECSSQFSRRGGLRVVPRGEHLALRRGEPGGRGMPAIVPKSHLSRVPRAAHCQLHPSFATMHHCDPFGANYVFLPPVLGSMASLGSTNRRSGKARSFH